MPYFSNAKHYIILVLILFFITNVLGNDSESCLDKNDQLEGTACLNNSKWMKRTFGYWTGFFNGLGVTIVTEFGDRTFFIAAILGIDHDRMMVFIGAMSAVWIMAVISTLMGVTLPNLIPQLYVHYASVILFLYFGIKLLKSASKEQGGPSDELLEVESELMKTKKDDQQSVKPSKDKNKKDSKNSQISALHTMTKAFSLCFFGEWGDRSQITAIALAADQDPFGVTIGACVGHAICTVIAIIGGRILAAKISERVMKYIGGVLFILFGIHSLYFGA